MSDSRKDYKADWQRKNSKFYKMRVNVNTDDAIIRWLELQPNVSSYLRKLVEDDITKTIKG